MLILIKQFLPFLITLSQVRWDNKLNEFGKLRREKSLRGESLYTGERSGPELIHLNCLTTGHGETKVGPASLSLLKRYMDKSPHNT